MKREKSLPCKLTDAELIERADQLIDCAKRSEELDWALERVKKQTKESQEGIKAQTRELREEIISRSAWRLVEVKEELDWDKNIATLYRLDTGEVVETRAITAQERQAKLSLEMEDDTEEPQEITPIKAVK